ncbi:unnamed protein product [Didymodactylos carnosus]|uniref:Uncharacterized protein n=1 Tax=Didymodactylos carnosus TaxID=1234261 RepID=A0A8S2KRK8_9BILA|nr:unnamed protein product [Didymodactylos carnosus]CAF3865759.1 unnamed protein product [Didymodactylos carnosus]
MYRLLAQGEQTPVEAKPSEAQKEEAKQGTQDEQSPVEAKSSEPQKEEAKQGNSDEEPTDGNKDDDENLKVGNGEQKQPDPDDQFRRVEAEDDEPDSEADEEGVKNETADAPEGETEEGDVNDGDSNLGEDADKPSDVQTNNKDTEDEFNRQSGELENEQPDQEEDTEVDDKSQPKDQKMPETNEEKPSSLCVEVFMGEINDIKSRKSDDDESAWSGSFITYFLIFTLIVVIGYLTLHNKNKLMGYLVEGRSGSGSRSRGSSSSSRPSHRNYEKLKNINDAMPLDLSNNEPIIIKS